MRLFTAIRLFSLLAGTVQTASTDTANWFDKPFGMFQINLREIDVDMDVNATADFIQDVGGILANYPTKLDFQIINPRLQDRASGDLVQDSLDAARARGLRLLARVDFSKVQRQVAEAHPEWLYISPNGTWQNHTNDLVSVCPSDAWYQERIFDILDEITDWYDLDGFFVNWAGFNENDYFHVYHGVCHCASCKKAWDEHKNGKELPYGPEDANYREWKTWSDGVMDEWTRRVRNFIAQKLPHAGLILGASSDILFYEANNAIHREIWHHATSETVIRLKSERPDTPVLVNCASFLDHAYRITSEDPHHFAQYHVQAISRGANPSTYIIGVPSTIPCPGFEQAGEIIRFHRANADVYSGMPSSALTALVMPPGSQVGEPHYQTEALSEYKGLYKAMQELHMPFDIVDHRYIVDMAETGDLGRYRVIVLPRIGSLYDEDAEALDTWVATEGTVIVTGAIRTDDNDVPQLQSLPASKMRENITDTQELTYEWKNGSTGLFKELGYAPFAPPEYIYGNIQIDERAVGIGSYGKGKAVLFTAPVGWGYRETGLSVFRDLFELVLFEVGAEEPLPFNFAPQMEVTVNTSGNNDHTLN
ncbi:glycosyl hydrolase 6-domain-containing protein [Emericellopsis atlantica]|uniref:Glycosyl hydrolase 6-domain-containing protein n=1 Tax=Emericellopsis atlantica TaxID=2614577 RepID=A0A9P7ZQB7_9HYPO|nr:glycosyl hydrolase 6-domain-containing protein [Emericellopsis atlantica]KAG9256240.1 glycosyl hydrolase 6-domain-containing protein [Emericellopsis atlantica]